MSMKQTWLPARLSVRHKSLTSPSENCALPAPITLILIAVGISLLLRFTIYDLRLSIHRNFTFHAPSTLSLCHLVTLAYCLAQFCILHFAFCILQLSSCHPPTTSASSISHGGM